MTRLGILRAVTVASMLTATPVIAADSAQPEKTVAADLKAFVVSTESGGAETFVQASVAQPGDTIEYRIEHTNNTGEDLAGFVVNGPVPSGTVFVGGSQAGPEELVFEARYDGSTWGEPPLRKTVKGEDGIEKQVIVPPTEYVAVRWLRTANFAAGGNSTVRYRVRVAR